MPKQPPIAKADLQKTQGARTPTAVKNNNDVISFINQPSMKEQLAAALPRHMTAERMIRIRAQSKAGNNGPWVTHWEEMAKKTAIRRLFKYLPVSIEIQRAVSMDEKETLTIDPADASVITGEYSVVESAGVEENVTA